MGKIIRIGTRESQLAIWQATLTQNRLKNNGFDSELVFIKSEGDVDTITPLYSIGVTGIFTKALDTALLNNRIDIAVHSMKDVPVQPAQGIKQVAVLKRGSHKDILVLHPGLSDEKNIFSDSSLKHQVNTDDIIIATSSVRRIAQWLHKYPDHKIENLRGNVNTRLQKLKESNWHGAIFAAAGLERIGLRPENSVDLDWMLPAPAQGAIMMVCRENDLFCIEACQHLNDAHTELCTKLERDFLSALLGGCSTPISAFAKVESKNVSFEGNIVSPDGKQKASVKMQLPVDESKEIGFMAAKKILETGGQAIVDSLKNKE
ncbi:MAG: hydroxymethylbilane synthase [Bacteroidetes bacterium]|nr:hydroxymethylbilane synthase [Bacteroidota bacterium]MBS1931007.1 hydroxymethylbilane synthase [Bacteroidota bacterium]